MPTPIKDPSKTNFKIGDMVYYETIPQKILFIQNISPSFLFCMKISDKAFEVQGHLGKVKSV